jgi:uncharacterized protein YqeY
MSDAADLRDRLRGALKGVLSARDRTAVTALRSAIAALDNAEAVPVARDRAVMAGGTIAGAAAGVGATEVPRRRLSDGEARAIVEGQVRERQVAADEYDRLGRPESAERLRREADVLANHLGS